MKITDLLVRDGIRLNVNVSSKAEAINQLVDLMEMTGSLKDKEAYKAQVLKREEEGTTGIGEGIAIPHGKCDAVIKPALAAMVIPKGVDYDSLDGEPVHLAFLIAAPNTEDNIHLDVLSRLSVLLMDEEFTKQLKQAKTPDEFLQIIDKTEKERMKKQEGKEEKKQERNCKILAVTACPTGIAHTYMAAEALEKKAVSMGHSIKVETRGSGGVKNVVTDREIAEADCIIVCADTNVPMERFDGKKVIQRKVSDGIHKAEELILLAESGEVEEYHAKNGKKEEAHLSTGTDKDSIGHTIYKHLMSGVSHMLPFVVGGGILIALAFLIDSMSVDLASLDPETRSQFGTITPTAALLKGIGGTAFQFMLPILAGFIAMSIGDRPGLLLGIVGGAIASEGKSGFLGALIAGFLAGYVIVLLKKAFDKLPESLEGIKPVLLYPFFGVLIMGLSMKFLIEPPIGALNQALTNGLNSMSGTSSILLGFILAGMMAVDLGGPVNKAAYVFGTAAIASGNYNVMAAVMIGGMVPPCAIALATLLFKDKFTAEERKSGPTNFVMGLSFISEGAIPFAAADPLHVIPALIGGSAVSGALSMAFQCELMAPHGGIFVFPVVTNSMMYFVSLVVGTIISAILLGVLKKKVN
ncbi:PTS fructose transporter subunit IIABC [Velocimicrobium porci]|uniref:PTS fructose transporter subunit IIC n=1 Tax=Velocimicrobium porci TaxID=2606634 RepID=A0A6L5XY54_9FIRM|nr:fructose-specific PTS transporter subunit EIIC [Velocimicrobium porci]MSS63391.1 PTS fructose transporter subunit IIC [Velocimicrobium porci]